LDNLSIVALNYLGDKYSDIIKDNPQIFQPLSVQHREAILLNQLNKKETKVSLNNCQPYLEMLEKALDEKMLKLVNALSGIFITLETAALIFRICCERHDLSNVRHKTVELISTFDLVKFVNTTEYKKLPQWMQQLLINAQQEVKPAAVPPPPQDSSDFVFDSDYEVPSNESVSDDEGEEEGEEEGEMDEIEEEGGEEEDGEIEDD